MRIDASQVLGHSGVKVKMGTGAATDSLKEGDVIRAGVVSNDKNGIVTLKTENGQSFNAKLGADIKLSPGDTVLLEVTGKEKSQVSFSFVGVEKTDEDLSLGQKNLVADFTDKSLAPFANKLFSLNMPVTEESARMMRDLIAQNPKLSLDEAAFLASNKLTGDDSLMKAALAIIADGDKTDAMITRLMSLVNEQTSQTGPDINTESTDRGSPAFTVSTANTAPLTDLLTTIVKSFSNASTIISQPNINLQTNAENAQEFLQMPGQGGQGDGSPVSAANPETTITANQTQQSTMPETVATNQAFISQESQGDGSPVSGANLEMTIAADQTQQNTTPETVATNQALISQVSQGDGSPMSAANPEMTIAANQTQQNTTPETVATNQAFISQVSQGDGSTVPGANSETAAANQTAYNSTPPAQTMQSMSSVVAQMLSDIPEFSGTPLSALHRFSEILLRVAVENPETPNSTEALTAQLDKLFTKLSKNDTDAGARLRGAREELYTRLALIEEVISRATQPARAEMLVQTQKLMDHVRLLNSIEQFVYMQLPVQLSEEKKTADLYVFKRKGGKRADPDNVNILLAIDLEFMGHWEALLNIKNKEVSIQMEVHGEAEKEHFNANTVMLHNMLTEAGFKLVSTNIKFSEEETTPLTALSAFDRYTGGKQGIIDFRI